MTTYNPFALPPRSIKEFLGEPVQSLDNNPVTTTKLSVPVAMTKPSVPMTTTVKSPTPILYDMSNEKIDPFSDGFRQSSIIQLPDTNTEDSGVRNSFIIILIIILTIVFLIIGVGVFVKYYVHTKPEEPDNTQNESTANQKPT